MVQANNSNQAPQIDTSEWEQHSLRELVKLCDRAREEKKHLFVWDKQGNVAKFFSIKGYLVDL